MQMTPTIADLMRQWRTLASLNTTEAGDRLGISARTVENIEQGRRRVGDVGLRIALVALIVAAKKSTRHRK